MTMAMTNSNAHQIPEIESRPIDPDTQFNDAGLPIYWTGEDAFPWGFKLEIDWGCIARVGAELDYDPTACYKHLISQGLEQKARGEVEETCWLACHALVALNYVQCLVPEDAEFTYTLFDPDNNHVEVRAKTFVEAAAAVPEGFEVFSADIPEGAPEFEEVIEEEQEQQPAKGIRWKRRLGRAAVYLSLATGLFFAPIAARRGFDLNTPQTAGVAIAITAAGFALDRKTKFIDWFFN